MQEVTNWATKDQLCVLFATMLSFYEITSLVDVWRTNYDILIKDILHKVKKKFKTPLPQLSKEQIENNALMYLETTIKNYGNIFHDIKSMPLPNGSPISDRGNRLLNEELSYDVIALEKLHIELFNSLNLD